MALCPEQIPVLSLCSSCFLTIAVLLGSFQPTGSLLQMPNPALTSEGKSIHGSFAYSPQSADGKSNTMWRKAVTKHGASKGSDDSDPSVPSAGVPFARLKKHTGLIDMYSNPSELYFDMSNVVKNNAAVLATATWARGTILNPSNQLTVLHEPVDPTEETLLTFQFSKDMQSVDVLRPQLDIRTTDNQSRSAVEQGAWSGWIDSLEKEVVDDGRVMVDAIPFIKNGFYLNGWDLGGSIFSVRYEAVRAYEKNILVTVALGIGDPLAQTDTLQPVMISFSMTLLPAAPMQPRLYDGRLPYFTVDYTNFGNHNQHTEDPLVDAVDPSISLLTRYNVTSHPSHQIRFYVDPTVPARWRPYFKKGIEGWNEAFREAGYNGEVVKAILPGDADWPNDYDPDDARYSTISWSVAIDSAYALGLAKVDPRSGEIVKSDIVFTAGWVRAYLDDLDREVPTIKNRRVSFRHESRKPVAQTETKPQLKAKRVSTSAEPFSLAALHSAMDRTEWENIVGEGLQGVVLHEVGHTLGLRHNFKASSGISTDCLRNVTCTSEHGVSLSVMDYVPLNVFQFDQPGPKHLFQTKVGAFDKLAIKYGYGQGSDVREDGSLTRPKNLEQFLESAESLASCSDEELSQGEDPLCAVHDLGSNPVMYYRERLRVLEGEQKRLLSNMLPGQPYTVYGTSAVRVMRQAASIADALTDFVGGVNNTHLHHGDHGPPTGTDASVVISTNVQLEALDLIFDVLKTKRDSYLPPPEAHRLLLQRVGIGAGSINVDELMRTYEQSIIGRLMSPSVLKRAHRSEFFGAPQFLRTYMQKLKDKMWGSGNQSILVEVKTDGDYEMQTRFVDNLIDAYWARCSQDIGMPTAITREVHRHLDAIRISIDSSLGEQADMSGLSEDMQTRSEEFESHLSYLKTSLLDVGKPCSSARATPGEDADGSLISLRRPRNHAC